MSVIFCKRDLRACEIAKPSLLRRLVARLTKRPTHRICREGVDLDEPGRPNMSCSDRYIDFSRQ